MASGPDPAPIAIYVGASADVERREAQGLSSIQVQPHGSTQPNGLRGTAPIPRLPRDTMLRHSSACPATCRNYPALEADDVMVVEEAVLDRVGELVRLNGCGALLLSPSHRPLGGTTGECRRGFAPNTNMRKVISQRPAKVHLCLAVVLVSGRRYP